MTISVGLGQHEISEDAAEAIVTMCDIMRTNLRTFLSLWPERKSQAAAAILLVAARTLDGLGISPEQLLREYREDQRTRPGADGRVS